MIKPTPVAFLSECTNDDNEVIGYTVWDKDYAGGCFPVYREPLITPLTHEEKAWLNEALNLGGRLAVIEAIEEKIWSKIT